MGMPSLDEMTASLRRFADGVVDTAGDAGLAAIEMVTGRDLVAEKWARNAADYGNFTRASLRDEQAVLGGQFTGGWDPQEFVEESFDSMSHESIVASVQQMNPTAVAASAHGWTAIGAALSEALGDFKAAIVGEIGAGWEGVGADSARDATRTYVAASDQLALAGRLVGSKVAEATTGITQVKVMVPPVEHPSILDTAANAVPVPGLFKALMHERNEARERAVQVMKTVYTPVMREADTRVPTLPSPPRAPGSTAPATPGGASRDSSGGFATGVGDRTTGYVAPGNTERLAGPSTVDGAGSPAPVADSPGVDPLDPNAVDATGPDPAADSPLPQPDPSSIWTRPAGAAESGTGTPGAGQASAGPGSPFGSGSGGPAGAGNHAGTGAGGGSHAGAGGGIASSGGSGPYGGSGGHRGAVAGIPVGSAPRGGAGLSGSGGSGGGPGASGSGGGAGVSGAASGAPGKPGAPAAGMVPAGARGREDGDTEHTTPGYLVTVDNGNDLVGTLPLVAPPVLGA
ncbi:hypothetical protein GCM10023094_24400 [Rhodococcus olei]|uniref:PPE family protein n=1 Tax=Rhodococcus olei TaxID=2161675 RepID=A0ABP8P0K9_9NOCA